MCDCIRLTCAGRVQGVLATQHAEGFPVSGSAQYGTQKKAKPRLTTKSGKTRHLIFRKHAQGKL